MLGYGNRNREHRASPRWPDVDRPRSGYGLGRHICLLPRWIRVTALHAAHPRVRISQCDLPSRWSVHAALAAAFRAVSPP